MKLLKTPEEMRSWSLAQKREGSRIAFVPTMGALHEGHLALLDEARRRADRLVLSIYVNPAQFGPKEDLSRYPRDLDGDLAKARDRGTDAVFLPSDKTMYPDGFETYVNVENVTKHLCGASRPGHFRGVATVVAKLFNIVLPDVAVFGEKDYQQLVVIRKMVRDLNFPVEIASHPIVREKDGLAMSSRNVYLSAGEREAALSLSRSLKEAQSLVESGERNTAAILSKMRALIESTGLAKIDYAEIADAETLVEISRIERPAIVALAVFVGKTRLIDNMYLVVRSSELVTRKNRYW